MKNNNNLEKLSNDDFITFVKEIKEQILSSQYEALKSVNKELINLWNMRNFYTEYKDSQKLQTLSAQIGWSHNVVIFQKCQTLENRNGGFVYSKEIGKTHE